MIFLQNDATATFELAFSLPACLLLQGTVSHLTAQSSELLRLQLNFPRSPGLVEPGFQRSIEPHQREPALAGNLLHPLLFKASRGLGAKPHIHRSIGIGFDALVLADHTGGFLVGLQHRAGLVVTYNHRPEILHLDIWG